MMNLVVLSYTHHHHNYFFFCPLSAQFAAQIYPHGSTDKNPYVTMGSGSLAAMSVFETGYREDLEEVGR